MSKTSSLASSMASSILVHSPDFLSMLNDLSGTDFLDHVSLLTSCLAIMMHRYSRKDEFLLGLYTDNEHGRALPVKLQFTQSLTLDLLRRQIAAHVSAGREKLKYVSMSSVAKAVESSQLFQVALVCRPVTGRMSEQLDEGCSGAPVDLTFELENEGGEESAKIVCRYNAGVFVKETVDRMLCHLKTIILAALSLNTEDEIQVFDLPLMAEEEHNLVTVQFGKSRTDQQNIASKFSSLAEIFTSASSRFPNKIAIECPLSGVALTYQDLDTLSESLAQKIAGYGLGSGNVVVIAAERCINTIIALVGVAKSGCAYMPVDGSYPQQRICHMIQEAEARLILCSPSVEDLWTGHAAAAAQEGFQRPRLQVVLTSREDLVLTIDSEGATKSSRTQQKPEESINPKAVLRKPLPTDTAAILYTSGSTGIPKGVVLSNNAMISQYLSLASATSLIASDRVAQNTTLTFDVAGNEIWGSFLAGATLVVVDESTRLLGFEEFLQRHRVSVLFITPSHLSVLNPAKCGPHLRTLAVAGEAVTQALVTKWASLKRKFINEYGPTEADVVSAYDCPAGADAGARSSVPIGFPVLHATLRILDPSMRPAPVGVPGELCIGGSQLADGYFKQPQLTASKFCTVSVGREVERLYRTGDLCRWRADGAVEFLGRIDRQVKLRGMRVEVEDIEAHLSEVPSVFQCCVDLRGAGEASALVAFVVTRDEPPWDEEAVRRALLASLPKHMIPSTFVLLDSLPYTSSGKVDRKRLPDPSAVIAPCGAASRVAAPKGGASTRGAHQAALVEIGDAELGAKAFLQSSRVQGLRQMGLDSLGIVRLYHSLVASAADAEWEARVADAVRAVCMFGVAVDHILACNPRSPCQAYNRLVLAPQLAGADAGLFALEAMVRSIGNYKTVAGFAMVSAYLDSGAGPSAASFGPTDLAVFLVYMLITWVFDPIATAIAGAYGIDTLVPWWLAQHRWYLLAMLYTRAAMVLLRALQLPPAVQAGLAVLCALLCPPSIGCVSVVCSGAAGNLQSWMDLSSAPEPFNFLFQVFYRGIEPQYANADWAPAFQYILPRKYLLVLLIYVVTFHYGRPAVNAARRAHRLLLSALLADSPLACAAVRGLVALASGGALVAIALGETAAWRANEDWWVQEGGPDAHGREPHITRFLLVVLATMVQVALIACFFAAAPSAVRAPLRIAGASTLGAYMSHSYINLGFAQSVLPRLAALGPYSAVAGLLALPVGILFIAGPIVQWATLAAFRGLSALVALLSRRLGGTRPPTPVVVMEGPVARPAP